MAYRLAPGLALRREPFGGIAYSYDTRSLRTIRSVAVVEVALRLDAGETVEQVAADLGSDDLDHIVETLVKAGVLCDV